MFLPVIGQALIKGTVLFLGDVLRVPRPDGLRLVKLLVLNLNFLDLFLLRFVLILILNLLDLGLLLTVLLDLFFVVFNLLNKMVNVAVEIYRAPPDLLDLLCNRKLNWI